MSQGAELTRAQGKAEESDSTAEAVLTQMEEEKKKSSTYEALLSAYAYLLQEDYDSAALKIQNVYEDYLTDDMWSMYNAVCSDTGVTGIKSEDSVDSDEEESDGGSYDDSYDGSYDDSYDDGYDESYDGSYDDSYDESYDDGYDDGGYEG